MRLSKALGVKELVAMKTKLKDFIQHLHHEIEAEEYLDNALPSIGLIVMYFNSLESSLDSVLGENFTNRTDSTGLNSS